PVAVISYRLAMDFARGRAAKGVVGDTLRFMGQPRLVIGVLKPVENERSKQAAMPAGAVQGAVVAGPFDRSASLLVTASTVEGVKPARAAIERWAQREFGNGWKDRMNVVADESRLDQLRQGLLLFKLFMGALMSIS